MIVDHKAIDLIDFEKSAGLVPAVIQHHDSGAVLMLGYMNREALEQTLRTGNVTFFSRSKQRLWTKGETSTNFLKLVQVRLDCDRDTLLVQAIPEGPTCHTGMRTCFGDDFMGMSFLHQLQEVIQSRKENPSKTSYTSTLFAQGIDKIAQKVGEEAVETVIEAKNENREKFLNESADLLYHLLVLLQAKEVDLQDVIAILEERHR